jgi:hypothetical protein
VEGDTLEVAVKEAEATVAARTAAKSVARAGHYCCRCHKN